MSGEAGKGSKPRPYSVTQDQYATNWNRIFKKDHEKEASKTNQASESVESGDLDMSRLQSDTYRGRG